MQKLCRGECIFVRRREPIRPFAQDGPHSVNNGLLLRADLHRLFEQGYIGITHDGRFERQSALACGLQQWEDLLSASRPTHHAPEESSGASRPCAVELASSIY